MRAWKHGVAIIGLCVLAACAGCEPPAPTLCERLQHEDPTVRARAVVEAARTGDQSAVPYVVDRLTDSDRAVRFYAILSLEKLTGRTFGYDYRASPEEQEQAARRWRAWLAERAGGGASTQPGESGSAGDQHDS